MYTHDILNLQHYVYTRHFESSTLLCIHTAFWIFNTTMYTHDFKSSFYTHDILNLLCIHNTNTMYTHDILNLQHYYVYTRHFKSPTLLCIHTAFWIFNTTMYTHGILNLQHYYVYTRHFKSPTLLCIHTTF